MAKYLPNPHNLSLFKVVMVPANPKLKTEVTIYAESLDQAKSKVSKLWGFSVISGKELTKEEPAESPKEVVEGVTKKVSASFPTYVYVVPDDASLGLFTYCQAPPPTEEQAAMILTSFQNKVTRKALVKYCTSDKKLVEDKPLDGVLAYIWQLARYMNGEDQHVPSTAFIDLTDGTSKLTNLRVDPFSAKPIMEFLETMASQLVAAVSTKRVQ